MLAALTAGVVSVSVIWTSSISLRSAVRDEELAHGREEVAEMRSYFSATEQVPSSFESIAVALQENHPATRFSWRVWKNNGEHWGDFGELSQLERVDPLRNEAGLEEELGGGFSWFTSELSDELVMGLLFNNSEAALGGRPVLAEHIDFCLSGPDFVRAGRADDRPTGRPSPFQSSGQRTVHRCARQHPGFGGAQPSGRNQCCRRSAEGHAREYSG